MKVTFSFDSKFEVLCTAENCTFEFIASSYQQFQLATHELPLSSKKSLKITFSK